MHTRLPYLRLGGWVPSRTNYLLLAIQVLLAAQGASRGMDYVQPRPAGPVPRSLTSIEAAFPLPVWGTLCLLAAAAVVAGLFGGWQGPVVIGHACLAALYAAFSYGLLEQTPLRSVPLIPLGVVTLIGGFAVGLSRWRTHQWLRFWLALILTVGGGWVAAYGLGYDFRTATGLLVTFLCHAAFAIGIAYIAYRPKVDAGAP